MNERPLIEIIRPLRAVNRFDALGVMCTMIYRFEGIVHEVEVVLTDRDFRDKACLGDLYHWVFEIIQVHMSLTYGEDYLVRAVHS